MLYAAGQSADLLPFFENVNARHFDGFLEPPVLRWNSRLRSSAGRFIPGSRKFLRSMPPVIEIASYLLGRENAAELILDIMAHEMIHYWLWVMRRPYGHSPEFHAKMRKMGVSRYNPAPLPRPVRYIYLCGYCSKEFPAKRKLGILACAKCCNEHSGGKYDPRFKLVLHRTLRREEGLQLLRETS